MPQTQDWEAIAAELGGNVQPLTMADRPPGWNETDEARFTQWYRSVSSRFDLDPNPDAPEHSYNYRHAFKVGAWPDKDKHWPSEFKAADHPNRFVDGVDTTKRTAPADDWENVAAELGGTVADTARPEHPHARIGRIVTDLLPTIGGMAGGVIGGIGGSVAGVGVGGVPGAIGGATVGGAAGEAGRQLLNRVAGRPAPASAGEAASAIGTQGAVQGAAEAIGGAVTRGIGSGARAVYRGYLKPSLAERQLPKAQQVVTTAMDEGLPVSEAGQDTGRRLINELKSEVDTLIGGSQRKVDIKTVADRVRAFARSKYFKPGADLTDFNAAMGVADKIDSHPSLGIPAGVAPSAVRVRLADANQIKRALDDSIGEAQFGVTSGAKTSAEKAGRHEMRQAIEAQVPEVGPLNARESALINATKAIARAVEREANQNVLYGWKTLASTGLGLGAASSGEDPASAAAMALAARYALRPDVATRAAIIAARASKQLGLSAASAARVAIAALSGSEAGNAGQ